MSVRTLNALLGFCAGSAAYYLFLFGALLTAESRIARVYRPGPDGFWLRVVRQTELTATVQPHGLYVTAILVAGLFMHYERPFREDIPLYSHRVAGLGWLFVGFVALNLWFALTVAPPRFLHL
jgi:hypothetical protein